MTRWKVTRIVREEFDVDAETREDALNLAEDPAHVTVVREWARRVKGGPPLPGGLDHRPPKKPRNRKGVGGGGTGGGEGQRG